MAHRALSLLANGHKTRPMRHLTVFTIITIPSSIHRCLELPAPKKRRLDQKGPGYYDTYLMEGRRLSVIRQLDYRIGACGFDSEHLSLGIVVLLEIAMEIECPPASHDRIRWNHLLLCYFHAGQKCSIHQQTPPKEDLHNKPKGVRFHHGRLSGPNPLVAAIHKETLAQE